MNSFLTTLSEYTILTLKNYYSEKILIDGTLQI